MAYKNGSKRVHSAPGVYFNETEITYAPKSMGITTLGVAGETLRGPAFQPIAIENWRQFLNYFGGTSTEKFKGSQYPKYELPYIAKTYLEQSNQLEVVRVLGLSGVNAGPAWLLTAYKSDNETCPGETEKLEKYVIGVLRSRGKHVKAVKVGEADPENGICEPVYEFDGIEYFADAIELVPTKTLGLQNPCTPGFKADDGSFTSDSLNYGTFTIKVKKDGKELNSYSVSLNSFDKNYIISVLGTKADNGDSEIYVEELYDVALEQLINTGKINSINCEAIKVPQVYFVPKYEPVSDLLTIPEGNLTKKDLGKRFVYSQEAWDDTNTDEAKFVINKNDDNTYNLPTEGRIYTVSLKTENNRNVFYYTETGDDVKVGVTTDENGVIKDGTVCSECVKNLADGYVYAMKVDEQNAQLHPITFDMNDYKEEYRYASTPWVVSEMKGSAENVELNKLFRFHTISDGDAANTEVKVSIENIDPTYGTFDVLIRDFYDTDDNIVVYEKFSKCDLVPGSSNYISYKIGSFDEVYDVKSRFVTVEVIENDNTRLSIPCGFLGYPVRNYSDMGFYGIDEDLKVHFEYNTYLDTEKKTRKQYFGISDIVGVDEDCFKYKGVDAYDGIPEGMTSCFHLDSRIISGIPDEDGKICVNPNETDDNKKVYQTVSVDGMKGYSWQTVGLGNSTEYGVEPRIGKESEMVGSIYEDKSVRKFTMAFHGGFDGWDYYRTSRSNSDEFSYANYKGNINKKSGVSKMFSKIENLQSYSLDNLTNSINSDYYAYLSAIRQFANPKTIEINLLATPGIDYVNNLKLVEDVIEMVSEERKDVLYVVTTPDKPFGSSDSVYDMYTPSDAVMNLDSSELDSNRVCTYYPWAKYYDSDNSQYIYLPITRDVLKSFAYTDNITFPWYGNAGWDRGNLSSVKPKKKLKLAEQDVLYDGRINFINSFGKEGDRIWGDKNLQIAEGIMNRISKRRLMLRIKKLCQNACIGLLFNPNDGTVGKSFEKTISPILDNIKSSKGIVGYKIEVDDSVEARERLELPVKIHIKPTNLTEYIYIDAIITPQSVVW